MWFHLLPLLLFFLFQLWWAVVSAQLWAQHGNSHSIWSTQCSAALTLCDLGNTESWGARVSWQHMHYTPFLSHCRKRKGQIQGFLVSKRELWAGGVTAGHSPSLQGSVRCRGWRWRWQWQWGHRGWGQSRGSAHPLAQLASCPPPHKLGHCKQTPWSSEPDQQQAQPWGPRKHPGKRQAQRKGHCKLSLLTVFPSPLPLSQDFLCLMEIHTEVHQSRIFSGKNPHLLSLPLNVERRVKTMQESPPNNTPPMTLGH